MRICNPTTKNVFLCCRITDPNSTQKAGLQIPLAEQHHSAVYPKGRGDITTTDPSSNSETQTIDYQNPDDWVINNTPTASPGDVSGADVKIREESGDSNWKTRHMSPIWQQGAAFWKNLKNKILKALPIDSPIKNQNKPNNSNKA